MLQAPADKLLAMACAGAAGIPELVLETLHVPGSGCPALEQGEDLGLGELP